MSYSTSEMMTVAAARRLRNGAVCFVGIEVLVQPHPERGHPLIITR